MQIALKITISGLHRPRHQLADRTQHYTATQWPRHRYETALQRRHDNARARDEIGEMARTVIVFRDSIVERGRLTQTQPEASRARERRRDMIASTISAFKHSIERALGKLRAASMQLEMSSAD